ncbi:hypothetical protein Tco_0697173 [Tanacetum coccineum]
MIWRDTSWRYGMGKKKVNEVSISVLKEWNWFCSRTLNNSKVELKFQLKHERENELVMVVILGGSGGESFYEGGDDFGVDVLCFHTCLTNILGFLEKSLLFDGLSKTLMMKDNRMKKVMVVVRCESLMI